MEYNEDRREVLKGLALLGLVGSPFGLGIYYSIKDTYVFSSL